MACVNLRTEPAAMFPGPDFTIGLLRFINPVFSAGGIAQLELRDLNGDGTNEIMVGSSGGVAGGSPLTIELPIHPVTGMGPTIAFVEAERAGNSTGLEVQAFDTAGSIVDRQTMTVIGTPARVTVMATNGIASLRLVGVEFLLYQICWS